ncbi:Acetoin:2,6-dichlorophenolindophenol oxidoreductase subunit alpha [subsurface metagenome]
MELDKVKLLKMYKTMVTIRTFETREAEIYRQGLQDGFVHLYLGEEAIATGVCAALRPDDFITSTHRGHGHLIAKGGNLRKIMAEIFGRETGYCKAKGGSLHIADFDLGMLGANGIVGAGIPIATGAGLSAKLRGTDQVTVCFFGDGATNQGTFHEGLNMASTWRLPVIYVCENNGYGVSTPISRVTNISDLSVRAKAYGIPGKAIDGNDVIRVYKTAAEAIDRARKGEGPTLIVCKTCRHSGHFEGEIESFPAYRTEEEIEECKRHDPIPRFRTYLVETEMVPEAELNKIDQEVKAKVEEAVGFAQESPKPKPESATEDLLATTFVKME